MIRQHAGLSVERFCSLAGIRCSFSIKGRALCDGGLPGVVHLAGPSAGTRFDAPPPLRLGRDRLLPRI